MYLLTLGRRYCRLDQPDPFEPSQVHVHSAVLVPLCLQQATYITMLHSIYVTLVLAERDAVTLAKARPVFYWFS